MNPGLARRQVMQGLGATVGAVGALGVHNSASARQPVPAVGAYPAARLPDGARSRFVHNINGLTMHVLEAGWQGDRPGRLLLHGFPELAYSWRNVMVPLAEAGYHVIAPDVRGYGRTTGWDPDYDGDLASYRRLNIVRDALGLVSSFGYRSMAAVIGHDFGSPIAAWCAVARPDVFPAVVLMSAPFGGTPSLPFDTADDPPQTTATPGPSLFDDLAARPRPRKHYQRYYTTREANDNMQHASQGIHAFLRAYYHYKSADWPGNKPFRLTARTAEEMAQMPTYYIMDLDQGMAETVAAVMPSATEIATNIWLPDDQLLVYSEEYGRTGFQGGLQHYRAGGIGAEDMEVLPVVQSSSRPCSFPAQVTGGRIRTPERWNACKSRPAPTCEEYTWWRALVTGFNRSNLRKRVVSCWTFSRTSRTGFQSPRARQAPARLPRRGPGCSGSSDTPRESRPGDRPSDLQ